MCYPDSAAVVGASHDPRKVGCAILINLGKFGFKSNIYPVNSPADSMLGHRAYRSIAAISGNADLAVVAIPASYVPDCVRGCTAKGIRSTVVIRAGSLGIFERGAVALDSRIIVSHADKGETK